MAELTIHPQFTLEQAISSSQGDITSIYANLVFTSSVASPADKTTVYINGKTLYDREQQAIISLNQQLTSSLNQLSALLDDKNQTNPSPGFPLAGEKIIRVGQTVDIIWNNSIVPSINLFFMKGGAKIPITVLKEQTDNSKSFAIDITHFSDEYLPCKVRLESTDVDTIFDESVVFKVLRSN